MEEICVPQEPSRGYASAISYDALASLRSVYFARPRTDYESSCVGDYR